MWKHFVEDNWPYVRYYITYIASGFLKNFEWYLQRQCFGPCHEFVDHKKDAHSNSHYQKHIYKCSSLSASGINKIRKKCIISIQSCLTACFNSLWYLVCQALVFSKLKHTLHQKHGVLSKIYQKNRSYLKRLILKKDIFSNLFAIGTLSFHIDVLNVFFSQKQ